MRELVFPPLHAPLAGPSSMTLDGPDGLSVDYRQWSHSPERDHSPTSYGPQGDPYAEQYYYPIPEIPPEAEPQMARVPPRKRRRIQYESQCGKCQQPQDANSQPLLICGTCGRAIHATCNGIRPELGGGAVYGYRWTCADCTRCEICGKKGDERKQLFCDGCDRGWHIYCLNPPLSDIPDEDWFCPICMPPPPDFVMEDMTSPTNVPSPESREPDIPIDPALQDRMSVASSSPAPDVRSRPRPTGYGSTRKKKKRNPNVSDDESDAEVGILPTVTLPPLAKKQPTIKLRLPARGKGKEKATEEELKGMFDDILTLEQRETTKTGIFTTDKERFDKSRAAMDSKRQAARAPPPRDISPIAGPSTRGLRSALSQSLQVEVTHSPSPDPQPLQHRIRTIRFGVWDITTWYDAPFPEEYASTPDGRLWLCEFCLRYMKSDFASERHRLKCKARHPPGDEIYRDGRISIFEVDGRKNKVYCQNLCLLSKMFLDHKSLFYDVEPFLFYVLTEIDDTGARFVGYFSKEKRCLKNYNLSCIMTLPVRQRRGWGQLLIDFSYLLSKKEGKTGTPERPLSGLGEVGYRKYWEFAIYRYMNTVSSGLSVTLEDISSATSLTMGDLCGTLSRLELLHVWEEGLPEVPVTPGTSMKRLRGKKNGALRRTMSGNKANKANKGKKGSKGYKARHKAIPSPLVDVPFVPPKHYVIHWDADEVRTRMEQWERKGYVTLAPDRLRWTPFISSRFDSKAAELAPEADVGVSTLVGGMQGAAADAEHAPGQLEAPPTPQQPDNQPFMPAENLIGTPGSKTPRFTVNGVDTPKIEVTENDIIPSLLASEELREPSRELEPRRVSPRKRVSSTPAQEIALSQGRITRGKSALNGDAIQSGSPSAHSRSTSPSPQQSPRRTRSARSVQAAPTTVGLRPRTSRLRSSVSKNVRQPSSSPPRDNVRDDDSDFAPSVGSSPARPSPRKRQRVESSPETLTQPELTDNEPTLPDTPIIEDSLPPDPVPDIPLKNEDATEEGELIAYGKEQPALTVSIPMSECTHPVNGDLNGALDGEDGDDDMDAEGEEDLDAEGEEDPDAFL